MEEENIKKLFSLEEVSNENFLKIMQLGFLLGKESEKQPHNDPNPYLLQQRLLKVAGHTLPSLKEGKEEILTEEQINALWSFFTSDKMVLFFF